MERSQDGVAEFKEREWLAATAHGDRNAFEALYGHFEIRVYRYLLGMVRSPEAAEELLADVMLEVWRGARRFAGASRPSTWVFGIAHHKALDRLRRRGVATLPLEDVLEIADAHEGPADAALRASLARDVARALSELSPDHRSVIELAFGAGYGYRDISEITGVPLGTVKTRMHYARKHLQAIFERSGIEEGVQ